MQPPHGVAVEGQSGRRYQLATSTNAIVIALYLFYMLLSTSTPFVAPFPHHPSPFFSQLSTPCLSFYVQ